MKPQPTRRTGVGAAATSAMGTSGVDPPTDARLTTSLTTRGDPGSPPRLLACAASRERAADEHLPEPSSERSSALRDPAAGPPRRAVGRLVRRPHPQHRRRRQHGPPGRGHRPGRPVRGAAEGARPRPALALGDPPRPGRADLLGRNRDMTTTAPTHAATRPPTDPLRRTSRAAGILYLITFVSIPSLLLYSPVGDADFVLGAGSDTGVLVAAFTEVVVALAG